MPRVPDTRASLILRLRSSDDVAAWRDFVAIYEPFVYRFARRSGFQDADARELVQNVLLAVVHAIGRWESDSRRARFRTWLFAVARNQFRDLLAKRARQPALRGKSDLLRIGHEPAAPDALERELDLEHRRALFGWAAERVRETVSESSWNAFWMTAVEEHPVDEAARRLGLSPGAVYVARSRVLARLREMIRQLEHDHAL
jgi:RNA polymerase sigma-70 factor (ECF subfamily)